MGIAHIIAGLVGVFVITLVFPPFYTVISDHLMPAMYPNVTEEAGQAAMLNIERMFFLAPVILILGMFFYILASSGRREYDSTRDRPPV